MVSDSIEILQANNLHLFNQNEKLIVQIEAISKELALLKKKFEKVKLYFSDALLLEFDKQMRDLAAQLVNFHNTNQISDEQFHNVMNKLNDNKNLLKQILSGKKNLIEEIEKQVADIKLKDSKLFSLERDNVYLKNRIIGLSSVHLDRMSQKDERIIKLENDNVELMEQISNQASVLKSKINELNQIKEELAKYKEMDIQQTNMRIAYVMFSIIIIILLTMGTILHRRKHLVSKNKTNKLYNCHKNIKDKNK